MHRLIRTLCFALLINQSVVFLSYAGQVVKLTSDPWPPYILGELGSEANGGSGVELLKAIFARVDGVDVSLPLVPWKRALKEVKDGTMDGIQLLRKTSEREQFMDYSSGLFVSRELVWYSGKRFPNNFSWASLTDLNKYTIGVVNGYSYSTELDKAVANKELTVVKANSNEQIFTMLVAGRIDLAIANESVGYALVKQYADISKILPAEKAIAAEMHYLTLSKKSPVRHVMPKINQAIEALKKEGVIDQIMFDR